MEAATEIARLTAENAALRARIEDLELAVYVLVGVITSGLGVIGAMARYIVNIQRLRVQDHKEVIEHAHRQMEG